MQVRAVAGEIAEFEGPVSIDHLVTLTVRSFGLSRCGAKKKLQIARQLRQLDLTVDADRPFEHISPVEIANAWRIIAARSPHASVDETRRSVLQAFGRRKMTRGIAAHLARAEALVC